MIEAAGVVVAAVLAKGLSVDGWAYIYIYIYMRERERERETSY